MVLVKGPTDGLADTNLTAERQNSINFIKQKIKLCLSLYYNEINSYILVNVVENHKFKAKDSETYAHPLRLGNISKDFSVDDMEKTYYMNIFMISAYVIMLLLLMIY